MKQRIRMLKEENFKLTTVCGFISKCQENNTLKKTVHVNIISLKKKKRQLELLRSRIAERRYYSQMEILSRGRPNKNPTNNSRMPIHFGPHPESRLSEEEIQQIILQRDIEIARQREGTFPQINPDSMTYEQLLELEESIGKVSKGLATSKIKVFLTSNKQAIPQNKYEETKEKDKTYFSI